MMILICFYPFPSFCLVPIPGLTALPLLSPSSSLKTLHAEECDIHLLPHNLFHHKLEEINLSRNKGNDIMMQGL